MATQKKTSRKTAEKATAKATTARTAAKAKNPRLIAKGKGYSTDIVDRARKGTQNISSILGSTTTTKKTNPNGMILLQIAEKLDTVIELLTQIV